MTIAASRTLGNITTRQTFGNSAQRERRKPYGATESVDRTSVRIAEFVADLVRAASPVKPSLALASWAGITPRAAEHILAGRNGVTLDTFFRLLRSPIGRDLWNAAWTLQPMPEWHERQRLLIEIAEDELRAEEKRARLEVMKRDATR